MKKVLTGAHHVRDHCRGGAAMSGPADARWANGAHRGLGCISRLGLGLCCGGLPCLGLSWIGLPCSGSFWLAPQSYRCSWGNHWRFTGGGVFLSCWLLSLS